jgi:hypothetical protein
MVTQTDSHWPARHHACGIGQVRNSRAAIGPPRRSSEPPTVIRFHNDVITLPTKTRPKKLSLVGSDGRLHTLLFKGSEDLRMDQRVMQLVAHVNGLLARRVRYSYCDGLRGQVYAVCRHHLPKSCLGSLHTQIGTELLAFLHPIEG